MIEIYPSGNGFGWRMISAEGRPLVERPEAHPCTFSAADAAKAFRAAFWALADSIDHRMGACI